MLVCESQKYDMEFDALKKTFEVCSKILLGIQCLENLGYMQYNNRAKLPTKLQFCLEAHLILN